MGVLGRDSVGELVQVRLADVGVAGGLESSDRLGRSVRYVLAEDRRPVGRRQSSGVEEVLDAERDTLAGLVRPREERVEGVSWRRCR
jgi:hypothetical protein